MESIAMMDIVSWRRGLGLDGEGLEILENYSSAFFVKEHK